MIDKVLDNKYTEAQREILNKLDNKIKQNVTGYSQYVSKEQELMESIAKTKQERTEQTKSDYDPKVSIHDIEPEHPYGDSKYVN